MNDKNINRKHLEKDLSGQILPDLLMEEVLDDLEMEEAGDWLLRHLKSDRELILKNHIYSTSLFSLRVDYDELTVTVSAELGCHPADEVIDLNDFMEVLSSRILNTPEGRVLRNKIRGRMHPFHHDILPS